MITFESELAREMQDMLINQSPKNVALLPALAAWQTEVENAQAAHASAAELKAAGVA